MIDSTFIKFDKKLSPPNVLDLEPVVVKVVTYFSTLIPFMNFGLFRQSKTVKSLNAF